MDPVAVTQIDTIRYRCQMARLRLFAGLRDLAGSSEVSIEARTVGEAISVAGVRYGADFVAGVSRSRIWLNGDEASLDSEIEAGDEIAILPPVSGGAGYRQTGTSISISTVAAITAAVGLGVLNRTGTEAWWAAGVVGVMGAWVADIATTIGRRGRDFPAGPTLLALLAAAVLSHSYGMTGVALGAVAAVVLPMGWAVLSDSSRVISILAPMVLVGVVGALATGALIVAQRMPDLGRQGVGVLLTGLVAGGVAAAVLYRVTQSPLGDPIMASGLATLIGTVVAAAVLDQDLVTFSIVGAVASLAMVSGRGFGSIIRTRSVRLTELSSGLLPLIDGAVLAAAVFLPVFRLFS